MNLTQLLRTDLRVGFRNYTYSIYLLAAFAYGLMIRATPADYLRIVGPLLIFFEPALLGFTFIGAMLFSEKNDGTVWALSTTPVSWRSYYLSKTLVMAALAVIGGFIILVVGTGLSVNYSLILFGVILTSTVYTLLGVAIAAKYRNLENYFVPLLAMLAVSLLPFAAYHGLLSGAWTAILYAIPSYPALYFFQAGFESVTPEILVISGAALVVWTLIAYLLARYRFQSYAVEGGE